MSVARLRAELAELRLLAAKKRRADIYEPWPGWMKPRVDDWNRQLAAQPCGYSYLLENLEYAPKALLKPQFLALSVDESGCRELYEMIKG